MKHIVAFIMYTAQHELMVMITLGFAVYNKVERLSKPCAFAEDFGRTSFVSLRLVSIRSGMSNVEWTCRRCFPSSGI